VLVRTKPYALPSAVHHQDPEGRDLNTDLTREGSRRILLPFYRGVHVTDVLVHLGFPAFQGCQASKETKVRMQGMGELLEAYLTPSILVCYNWDAVGQRCKAEDRS